MDDRTSFTLDQTDEDFLTYTASDEALEAAAGYGNGVYTQPAGCMATVPITACYTPATPNC
jgi:hypothetical protein